MKLYVDHEVILYTGDRSLDSLSRFVNEQVFNKEQRREAERARTAAEIAHADQLSLAAVRPGVGWGIATCTGRCGRHISHLLWSLLAPPPPASDPAPPNAGARRDARRRRLL